MYQKYATIGKPLRLSAIFVELKTKEIQYIKIATDSCDQKSWQKSGGIFHDVDLKKR